jgi:prevent-host-death family protein
MKIANIATAKNQLSKLLQSVKRGETVLITERNKPVARLSPVQSSNHVVSSLLAEGVLRANDESQLDIKAFLKRPRTQLSEKKSLSRAILEERER